MHLEVIRLFLKNLNVVSRTETGSSFQPIVVFNDIFEVSVGKGCMGNRSYTTQHGIRMPLLMRRHLVLVF